MVELFGISHSQTETLCARNKPFERVLAQFAVVNVTLIDANRGKQRQTSCVTNVEQSIQMSIYTIHLMPCL